MITVWNIARGILRYTDFLWWVSVLLSRSEDRRKLQIERQRKNLKYPFVWKLSLSVPIMER